MYDSCLELQSLGVSWQAHTDHTKYRVLKSRQIVLVTPLSGRLVFNVSAPALVLSTQDVGR